MPHFTGAHRADEATRLRKFLPEARVERRFQAATFCEVDGIPPLKPPFSRPVLLAWPLSSGALVQGVLHQPSCPNIASLECQSWCLSTPDESTWSINSSLPEFLDFKLFGKTILEVNKMFRLFLANPLRK